VAAREFKDAIFEQFARVGAAISSSTRVETIDRLALGDRDVELIASVSEMTVANTSRHLQILLQSAVVRSKRDVSRRAVERLSTREVRCPS
jgi:DNA-binding transcriptional ArsR family regulator